jgi:hypothetical protein
VRNRTKTLGVLLAGTMLLLCIGMFGATVLANDDPAVEFTWGYAPNVYGSPDWAPWWADAKDDIIAGTFFRGTGGTFAGTTLFIPVDETVYSFGDLGRRIHWIYRIPGTTIAEQSGLFEVKWVVDWEGDDWTYEGGGWAADGPEVGWSEPTRWEEYLGDVFGSVGFAWWGAYGYTSDTPEARAQLEADLEDYWVAQTHATGYARWRASCGDPWNVTEIRLVMMPKWAYLRLTETPVFTVVGDCSGTFLDRSIPVDEQEAVGELPVVAIYEIGESIEGCVPILDADGRPVGNVYLPMCFYRVTVTDSFFDIREPLRVEELHGDRDGCHAFSIPTDGLDPGYYDIRLGLPDGTVCWIRVQLVEAS